MVQAAAPAPAQPSIAAPRRTAAYAIALLTLVSFFNYMDRMVLAVLLQPIKLDLRLSDTELGLLSGIAFALLYATLGVPLGRIADRAHRVRLLSVCLGLWTLATGASGLARNFLQLFFARAAVGIGEAGCVPAAHSLIGDYLSPARRPLGISLFQAGGLAGLSAGLMVTGLIADRFGWREALWLVGASGAPLALLIVTTLREPLRRGHETMIAQEPAREALAALLRRPALVHLVLALSIGGFGTYGIAQWLATFYIRVQHLTLSQIGVWTGLAAGAGGIAGVLVGGALAVRLVRRDPRWELWLPSICYGGGAPLYAALVLSSSAAAAMGIQCLATFWVAAGGGVALSAIQSFAEPNRRATAISLVLFLSSLLGLGLGPLAVGALSDALAPGFGAQSLRYALLISTAALLWAGAHFYAASRSALRDRL
jgi:predicted MFS family arabinose efflux permease